MTAHWSASAGGRNYWVEHAAALAAVFLRSDGSLVVELLVRALRRHLTEVNGRAGAPIEVLDVGGGDARLAVALARDGHRVKVLDLDAAMLDAAGNLLARERVEVRERVHLIHGRGEDALGLVGADHDLVCCHSVLLYLSDPLPLLRALVTAGRPGGLLSVMSVNADAIAMRDGLQGRWRDAVASLRAGAEAGAAYLPSAEPRLRDVAAALAALGAPMQAWYGIGIFTDHLTQALAADDPAEVVEAEWLAGERDPYRSVARCWHLLARRGG